MIVRLIAFLVIVAALVTVLLVSQKSGGPLVVSGFVEADTIRIGSRVGGRVKVVHVEEGASVVAGQILVEFEEYDLAELRLAAEAQLAALRAEHERLLAGLRPSEIAQARARRDRLAARLAELEAGPRAQEISSAQSKVRLTEAQLELAQQEFERAKQLTADKVTSIETLDRATARLRVEEAALDQAHQELSLLEEGTRAETIAQSGAELAEAEGALTLAEEGFRKEDIAKAAANVAASKAELQALERRFAELVVRAPIDSVIESLDLRPGDLVPADAPVLSLLDPARLWVRAYVPENALDISLGRVVSIGVDSFPTERFRGELTFIARQAEFTPGNVQTPEERSKQVFRIEVDLREGLERLRPGMAADVYFGSD